MALGYVFNVFTGNLDAITPGSSGTVTSVALSAPSIFTVSGSPVTTSGTLTLTLAAQTANTVFAGPTSGGNATPTFRSLVSADVPILNQNTTGTASNITATTNSTLVTLSSLSLPYSQVTGAPGGTVISVGFADTSTTPIYTITNSPITSSGTIDQTLNVQLANTVFSGPVSGGSAQPSFRALVSSDIPSLSATYVTQSEVGAPSGVASLDGSGKVPVSQLPSSVMEYEGTWNPSTNTPSLSDGTGTNGNVYWVSAAFAGPIAGLSNSSMYNFQIGDLILYSGALSQWELTTPAAGVQSVNGAQGVVVVNAISQLTGDATAGPASGSQSEALTLATVNPDVGSFTNANITVNAKGLITAVTNGTSNPGTITSFSFVNANGFTGTVSNSTTTPALTLTGTLTGDVTGTLTATALTATTNSTLTTLSALSLPYSQITGAPAAGITQLTGDVTAGPGSGSQVATLATVNSNVGTFGSSTSIPTFTVNAKGLITAASSNVVVAPAGTLTGTTLASNVVTSSLTTVGTIGSGVWNGTTITVSYGGTGDVSFTANQVILGGTTSTGALTQVGTGTAGQVLQSNGAGAPTWTTNISGNAANITGGISLTSQVTGILPIAFGGTNSSTMSGAFNNLNPMTTTGDIIYESAGNVASRLPIGSNGQILLASGGIPVWTALTLSNSASVTGVLPSANVGLLRTINAQTGATYTFVLADGSGAGGNPLVTFGNAGATTVTMPPNSSVAFPVGTQIDCIQQGAGSVTFVAGAGVTINSFGGLVIGAQYVGVTFIQVAANNWTLVGYLT